MMRLLFTVSALFSMLAACSDNLLIGNLDDKAPRTVVSVILMTPKLGYFLAKYLPLTMD